MRKLCCLVLAMCWFVSVPATATARPAPQLVMLFAAPRNRDVLYNPPHRPASSRAERLHLLEDVRPGASSIAMIEDAARGLGLHVVRATRWSVTAEADARTIRDLFGSARAVNPSSPSAQALPRIPARLSSLVSMVAGGDETRSAMTRRAQFDGYSGSDLRDAYGSKSAPPAAGSSQTVATLQFSGWSAQDLTDFASSQGLSDPVASGRYTSVAVDGADPSVPDGTGGEHEVALDQESILSVDPYAAQRAYFAPNSIAGFIDALHQVAADAGDATHDYFHLTALSISYGSCEAAQYQISAIEDAIAEIVDAGVSVFASSGDDGAFDCAAQGDDQSPAVDYPASSPRVVGVGGTTLQSDSETAWSGSGGGESAHFDLPAYQRGLGTQNARRLVPDIALDADPATGFRVLSDGEWVRAGGTSLASPLAAAMLANLIGAQGFDWGIGDIHANLYAAPSKAFHDITSGDNGGWQADRGFDFVTGLGAPQWSVLSSSLAGDPELAVPKLAKTRSVKLAITIPEGMQFAGWLAGAAKQECAPDLETNNAPPKTFAVSSDGAQTIWLIAEDAAGHCYSTSATTFVDSVAPVAKATAKKTKSTVRFTWSASDASPSSKLAAYQVVISHTGAKTPDYKVARTTKKSVSLKGAPGAQYTITVRAFDEAGNASKAVKARVTSS